MCTSCNADDSTINLLPNAARSDWVLMQVIAYDADSSKKFYMREALTSQSLPEFVRGRQLVLHCQELDIC